MLKLLGYAFAIIVIVVFSFHILISTGLFPVSTNFVLYSAFAVTFIFAFVVVLHMLTKLIDALFDKDGL